METTMQNGHTVITAGEGNFLMRKDGEVYGISLSLGIYDRAENYDELPLSQWPEETEEEMQTEE